MKVICTQENLKAGLVTVGRIISSSSTLPILNNVLLKTENGMLKISSTNLEIAITTHIRCKVEEDGGVTVVSKTITDLVNNLPNNNITIKSGANGELDVETENYHTSIKTLPAEEFPLIPTVESKHSVKLDGQVLKNAIDQVVFASATNQTQPEITGVLFSMDSDGLRVVATDRYRLAEKKVVLPGVGFSQEAIVPHKTALELSRVIGTQKSEVETLLSETQVSFTVGDTQIISRLVDGQYPDYKQIIPSNFLTQVVVEKQALASALRAGGIFSQSANSVKLEYLGEKQVVVLSAESQDLGKSVVELPAKIEGNSGSLILNYHYILDCLQSMESPNVIVKIIDDNSASLIVPEGKEDYIYLVMPIKN